MCIVCGAKSCCKHSILCDTHLMLLSWHIDTAGAEPESDQQIIEVLKVLEAELGSEGVARLRQSYWEAVPGSPQWLAPAQPIGC